MMMTHHESSGARVLPTDIHSILSLGIIGVDSTYKSIGRRGYLNTSHSGQHAENIECTRLFYRKHRHGNKGCRTSLQCAEYTMNRNADAEAHTTWESSLCWSSLLLGFSSLLAGLWRRSLAASWEIFPGRFHSWGGIPLRRSVLNPWLFARDLMGDLPWEITLLGRSSLGDIRSRGRSSLGGISTW